MGKRINIKKDTMFGNYKVIDEGVYMVKDKSNRNRGHIKVECTLCNTEHLIRADILKSKQATKCRACSNKEKYLANVKSKKIAHKGYSTGHQGTGDLSKTQLLKISQNALKRNIEFDDGYMTTDNLWTLMIKQGHKCALSGLDITLKQPNMTVNKGNLNYKGWNASLDRINSNIGYIEGNVQWVHRDINFMKRNYDEDYFIKLCDLVINHANQQPS